MKNLRERTSAMRESRGKDTGWLYCPQFSLSDEVCVCLAADCAHYNPDTQECVHVEAAQAQVRIAELIDQLVDCTTARGLRPERVLGVITE